MSGRGAWPFFYSKGMAVPDDRVAAGIRAFKRALIDVGYGHGIDVDLSAFGHAMDTGTRTFQETHDLVADGIIGPATARALFRQYSFAAESGSTIEIPNHLLQRLGGEESGHDPVAQGYADPDDEGWAQINLVAHPKITQAQAWVPVFAIPWASKALRTFYVNAAPDWDGAVAAYNIGSFYAKKWVANGKPASGELVDGLDIYARATHYVAAVKGQVT